MARVSLCVRSGPSRNNSCLRFVNSTARRVNVIWVDYYGGHQCYGTIEPQRHFDIHSFEGHPWISVDTITGQRMMLNNSDVFYPRAPRSHIHTPPYPHRCQVTVLYATPDYFERRKREIVYITLPVFTLKDLSFAAIIRSIRQSADIDRLNLPKILQAKLHDQFNAH